MIKPQQTSVRADLLMILASLIWGLAFVAQRMGMEHIGPFLFNGIRFAIGGGTLLIAGLFIKKLSWHGQEKSQQSAVSSRRFLRDTKKVPWLSASTILLGLVLFAGASLQQAGIVYTTAGNAGFITGFYVIFVPIIGLFIGQRPGWGVWAGALLALAGMYFLSGGNGTALSYGDLLVFLCSIVWAGHVLLVGHLTSRHSFVNLAVTQYIVCAILSIITAIIFEKISWDAISQAIIPILYGGLLAVGVAFTLQIVAQKNAPPAHAAIILSLESVFAVAGGVMILNEELTVRKWIGCFLMLTGMMIAQLFRRSLRLKRQV